MSKMDLFGKETGKRISAVEKEVLKLRKVDETIGQQLTELKGSVAESIKRSPDYERDAKQSSKKASECKNKAVETLQAISTILDEIIVHKGDVTRVKDDIDSLQNDAETSLKSIKEKEKEISDAKNQIFESIEEIKIKLNEVTEAFEEYPDLSNSLEELNEFVTKVEENENKSGQLLKSISTRKNDIDKIYREIYGFEQENDEDEEPTHVPGLKDELEKTYQGLDSQAKELSKTLADIRNDTASKLAGLVEANKKTNNDLADEWGKKHEEINKKIKSLLPNALTAGLSYAFSEKKVAEDQAYEKHKKQFGNGIAGLVIVSVIPFIVSLVFLLRDMPLEQVIDKIPRIVLAIIPLYLPVLWLAFSSSKKMNLSKRLIEEYSHKEVLSKTFEGLSSQINDLDDESISSELRIKLLQNFMQVYSENPGKLISNYETSDHPIMEVLDQSYKLESAVEKLRKIPGLDKVSRILETKSEKILDKGDEMVEKGLEIMEKLDEETS